MPHRYILKVNRPPDKQPDRGDFTDYQYPLARFNLKQDIRSINDKEVKTVVDKVLKKGDILVRPPGYKGKELDLQEEEEGQLVYYHKGGGKFWEGVFEVPEKIRNRDEYEGELKWF